MPLWGWVLIVVVAIIAVPLKLKVMKKMLTKKDEKIEE